MGAEPVSTISGIGARIAARLGEAGITTVAELAAADHHDLARRFGPRIGPSLRVMGMGGFDSPVVDEPHVPRGRSHEVTYPRDLTDADEIAAEVARLAEELTVDVVADLGRRITHVEVKVRTATFFTRSKSSKLAEPTTDPAVVAERALVVLARFETGRPIRLLGVRVVFEDPPPVRSG
jgi:DNA polymerase-4